MIKETPLTQAQLNEFELNKLGYCVKVRDRWDNTRKKKSFLFDIVKYDNNKEVIIQAGTKVFAINELEAIKQRDKIIAFYLNKLKNN